MVEVHLWGGLRPVFGGASTIETSASTIRDLFRELSNNHPGFQEFLNRGIAVSINGKIFRDNWDEKLHPQDEIYLLPRIAGG